MKANTKYFTISMIILNVIANISIDNDVSFGEPPMVLFDFSRFIIVLIFILTAHIIIEQNRI